MDKLDPRLALIYQMVPLCRRAADVGTDHGYLICALVESGRAESGIAADIAPLPLDKARREAESRGLSHRVRLVLGDGLAGVGPGEADAVIIAGMGGETIAHILESWPHAKDPGITWLLQPMTKAERLRDWLWDQGFSITRERCATANRRVYSVMEARYTGERSPHPEWERHLGAVDPGEDRHSLSYAAKRETELDKIAYGLERTGTPEGAERAKRLREAAGAIRRRMEERSRP